jgi:CubicO group peptidase (beta-lactamase class C family)
MEARLDSEPGTKFVYSDINYITLGAIVEKVSGETLDVYADRHIFGPLGMRHTRYQPFAKACGYVERLGAAIVYPNLPQAEVCPKNTWTGALIWDIAPTQHDNEGTAETNPDFDHLLRGTVHDPTSRRMGGVAGHAGVFSTAYDVARFAEALLEKLLYDKGPFPLQQSTLRLMTEPEQPKTAEGGATVFTADGKATTGVAARGFGWDINSAFSRPRGEVFPTTGGGLPPSFGHTGFTGTSLWMDPASDTYVVLLANAVHPRGAPPISPLRGEVATDVAKALGIGGASPPIAMSPR